MRNFRNIAVWEKGIELVKKIYSITNDFPESEKFGLISQMRRAAVSIPSNISEGASRNSEKDFKRFMEIAVGSAFELETQLIVSKELNFIQDGEFNPLLNEIQEVQKMLNGFISKLKI